MLRRTALALSLALTASAALVTPGAFAQETVTIDAGGKTTPLPHFWDEMFGSGRANLTLRAQYRDDLRKVASVTDFQYVRFHAIFQDENGVYDEDAQGNPVYNWSYVDQIYDGLLENGIKPYVEISFMPKKLASRLDYHAFWYKQIVAPPKDYAKWDALVTAFAKHLVDRYGIEEVSSWYFEVWNEPNIDFWTGRPAQQTYFELYDHTAKALKAVNPKIRVGGPATAQAAWVGDMIDHATKNNVPLDFVSTHVYGNDVSKDVFGDDRPVAPHQMVCAAVDKVHDQIEHSAKPKLPLIWSEFNATYMNQPEITDSIYMGPWLADTIRQCDGKVQMMSYWTFSDVFEEQGVVKKPFYGGYGLLAEDGIPKPAFNAFKLLHKLGNQRIAEPQDDVLVTRRGDDTIVIAAWNLVEPGQSVPDKTFTFSLSDVPWKKVKKYTPTVTISHLDAQHGDTLAAWKAMGSPDNPTPAQIAQLKQDGDIGKPETHPLADGQVTVTVPQQGLAVIEIR
ncbi:GH39 family glycosyl hydrolase [Silvibacterium sp.]|uniref:GH39 family glycosyl hydrolase n=1 Tax=Silvibacterium sp. TaxID=1964179 RepID=UPI0039E5FE5E